MIVFIIILGGFFLYDFLYWVAVASLNCMPPLNSAVDIFLLAAVSTIDISWWPKWLALFSVSLLLTGIYKQSNRRIR